MTIVASGLTLSLDAVVDVAIRVALLIALTFGITSCLRKSAALRHAVWMGAIALLFVVPWLPRVAPDLTVASVPSLIRGDDGAVSSSKPLPLGLTSTYRRTEAGAGRAVSSSPAPIAVRSSSGNLLGVAVLALWLMGAAVVIGRVILHSVRIRRITDAASDAAPIAQTAKHMVRSAALDLGVRRPVHVAWSDDVTGPLTWGVRTPFVILPSSSNGWSEARLRAVLRHELAHVQRFDYVSLLIGHLATAVFWWHPAVWFAVRSAARECERACDDTAIHLGLSMYDYAHHLVAIAREYAIGSLRPSAVGMADRRALKDRVKRIMSPSTDRRPLTRRRVGLAWGLAAVVAMPLVVIQVTPRLTPVPELIQDLQTGDVATRSRAAWRLGERETPEAVPALMAALQHADPGVRGMVVWALGEIKDPRALPALETALADADPFVREMAVLAVGELEDDRSIAALRAVFDERAELRPAVLWALGQIDDRSGGGVAARTRALDTSVSSWEDGEELEVDPQWLEDTPRSTETVSLLLRELEDPDPTVRRDAAWALGRAGATEAVDALIAALRDPDPRVRGVAVWALDEINPSR